MKHSQDILTGERPVYALCDEYAAGFIDPMHTHEHVQILYASTGVMSVRTPGVSFVVPPQRAVWMPVKMPHEVSCRGPVSLRTLYLHEECDRGRRQCRVFEVSSLLKALILETVEFEPRYDLQGREGTIIGLLLDEIARMPDAPFEVTMPTDPRLLRACHAILADATDPRDIDDWARLAGMGRRTFTRAFKRETGMGLAVWRQQARLMQALSMLASGETISQVAYEVGYDSPSGFSAMFRRTLGASPSQYLR